MFIIQKYFPNLNQNQFDQFNRLEQIFKDWNQKINLVSRKDIDALYERHILHSLAIAKLIQFKKNTQILDLGTGGGFPGIPLAILFTQTHFHLIDSIGKKINVVKDIAKQLKLSNVLAEHKHSNEIKIRYHFIISRAVTAFPAFVKLVEHKISENNFNSLINGILYLKGGNLNEELKDFRKKVITYPISDYFSEEFFQTKYVVYLPLG